MVKIKNHRQGPRRERKRLEFVCCCCCCSVGLVIISFNSGALIPIVILCWDRIIFIATPPLPPYHRTTVPRTQGQLWTTMETTFCCRDQQEVEGTLVQTYLPMAALVSMFSLYNKNEMKLGWLTGQASWVPRLSNTPSRFLSRSPRSPPSSSRPRLRLPPFFPFAFTRTRMHFPSLPEKQTRSKRKQVRTKCTRATEERQ